MNTCNYLPRNGMRWTCKYVFQSKPWQNDCWLRRQNIEFDFSYRINELEERFGSGSDDWSGCTNNPMGLYPLFITLRLDRKLKVAVTGEWRDNSCEISECRIAILGWSSFYDRAHRKKKHVEKALKVVQQLIQPSFIHFQMKMQKFCFRFQDILGWCETFGRIMHVWLITTTYWSGVVTAVFWHLMCTDCFWYVVFCTGELFHYRFGKRGNGPWVTVLGAL